MDIFFHAMNYSSKGTIVVASRSEFRRKSTKKSIQLIAELAKSNYKAPYEALRSSGIYKEGGMIELRS